MKTNHHTTKLQGVVKPLRDIGFLTIALTLALIANFTYAQFTSPTEAPTGGNIDVPVNTSATTQTKPGYFGLNVLYADNRIRSNLYCNRAGSDCRALSEFLMPVCADGEILVASGGGWVCCG